MHEEHNRKECLNRCNDQHPDNPGAVIRHEDLHSGQHQDSRIIGLDPEQKRFDDLCDSIASKLERAEVGEAALQATLPEVRERLARRRYPELFQVKRSKSKSKKR